jgi:integrase
MRVAIILLSQTGGRTYSEGFSLRWDQVDFGNKLIRLDNDVKTLGSAEPVPLSEYACEVLQAWNKEQASKGPFVFPSPHLPHQPISTVKTTWKATLRRAGVPHFPIYNLRHVFCTRLWRRSRRSSAARDATHKPGNQASLSTRYDGSSAASC